MEPLTAKNFRDEYAEIEIDASRIIWIATANDPGAIPDPLLSRFRRFQIQRPNDKERAQIAQRLYTRHAEGLPGMPRSIPATWQDRLNATSLRQLRLDLQEAIGRAALRASLSGRKLVAPKQDDLPMEGTIARRHMGFV